MHPRTVFTLVLALSAQAFVAAIAAPTFAQQPAPATPARPSPWVMPAIAPSAPSASTTAPAPRSPRVNPGNLPAVVVSPSAPPAGPQAPAPPLPTAQIARSTPPDPDPSAGQTATLHTDPSAAPSFARQPGYGPRAESPNAKPAAPREWAVDLGVGTEIPISVGGLVTVEVPHRLLLQLGVGVLPRAYAEAIDGVLTGVGAYDGVVSSVMRGSLSNSLVVRGSLGARPFEGHGFEMFGGYTLMTMGGEVATADVINAILLESGSSLQAPATLGPAIPLSATLHNIHASIGWRWLLANDHLVLRASLSYLQTLDSHVSLKAPESAGDLAQYEGLANQQINEFLAPYFARYAKLPTLGLSAAFRF